MEEEKPESGASFSMSIQARAARGRFAKGVSGNPGGRPPKADISAKTNIGFIWDESADLASNMLAAAECHTRALLDGRVSVNEHAALMRSFEIVFDMIEKNKGAGGMSHEEMLDSLE